MTIKEIAKMAGVSITAVSFFLNDKQNKLSKATIEKLDRIIKETGFKPNRAARNMRLPTTNQVAIVVFDISQKFAQETFKSISEELKNDDLVFSLYESHLEFEKEKSIVNSLIRLKVNSIVIQPSKEMLDYLPNITNQYPNMETKIILIDSKGADRNYGYVYNDSDADIEKFVKIKSEQNVEIFYYISDEISKLQIREYRYSRLKNLTKKYGMKLEVITSSNGIIPNKEMHKATKNKESINKVFWANNVQIAFDLYRFLDFNDQINSQNSIVVFNKCYFKPIVKIEMDHIDTHISQMGTEAAKQIRNKTTSIKKIGSL